MKRLIASLIICLACIQVYAYDPAVQTNVRPKPKEITPNAGPRIAHGADVFVTAQFIWWKVFQEGLNYALTGIRANPGTTLSGTGTEHTPDFGWEPGFKVGLGVNLPHDGWDIYAQYTWIQSHHNDDRATSADANMQEGFLLGALTTSANLIRNITEARTHWDLNFNVLDLEFGRNFYVSEFLTLRPFGGLKFTWQDQDWDSSFTAEEVGVDNIQPGTSGFVRSKQDHDTWGVGIRTGLNGSWFFTKNWSLFANTALSAMWTDYDIDRKDSFHPNSVSNGTTALNVHRDEHSIRAVTEFQLGLKGEWWFSNDDYHLAVSAAYEQQVWINYGSYIFVINDADNDLSFHGLTVKARFDF